MSEGLDGLRRELERRWVGLPNDSGSGLVALDLPTQTRFGAVLLGRAPTGRCLLVPFPPDRHAEFADDRRSRSVHLIKCPIDRSDGRRWYAQLLCLDGALNSVFTTLCADLVLRLETEETDPVAVTLEVLRAWRALFASGGRLLTVRQLGGLFGELLVLQRLLTRSADAGATWRGPYQERHDFLCGTTAIEVKTMLAADTRSFRVHGVEQLVAPEGGILALAALRVDVSTEAGVSVPDLATELIRVGGGSVASALAAGGYREADADAYRRHHFELIAESWYEVDADFPRITSDSFRDSQVPTGIDDLHYTVDLDQTDPEPMSPAAVDSYLEAFS
jgi:hypothetical protein